jgi:myo-inositol-1(or 4)-monophosphatase
VANFQAGIPIWGMSIALLDNFWPIFGVFYMPATGDLFHARAGKDAFWGNDKIRIPDADFIDNESLLLTYSRFNQNYRSTFPGNPLISATWPWAALMPPSPPMNLFRGWQPPG